MKKKILLAVVGLAILPVTAQASLQLKLDFGGSNTYTVADGASGDLVIVTGVDSTSYSFGGWLVDIVTGSNIGGSATSPSLSLTSFNLSFAGPGTGFSATPLKIYLTDTGYASTAHGKFDLGFGGTQLSGATITSKYFYDTANNAFAETYQIGTTETFTSTSYSSNQLDAGPGGVISGPYSLTMETNITNTPNGYFTTQFTSTLAAGSLSAVPVPAAVWLFGTGLMGLLYSGKRKQQLIA